MTHYIDTSALVATVVQEAHTQRIRPWLLAQTPGTAFVSDWCHTEVASALALKLRTGALTQEQRAEARTAWERLHAASLPTLAVTSEHFETAAAFASQHDLGLRAGDALHLAIAREGGHTLVTLDTRMALAALELGIPVERV